MSGGDKRYFVGMPSPAAAAVPAATVYVYPWGLYDYREALPALAMVLVPAILMVSTDPFPQLQDAGPAARQPYTVLIFIAAGIVAVATHPRFVLVAMAYSYLASAFIGMAITRVRSRGGYGQLSDGVPPATPTVSDEPSARDERRALSQSANCERDNHRRAFAALTADLDRSANQLDVPLRDGQRRGRCRSPWSRSTARRFAPDRRRPCRCRCRPLRRRRSCQTRAR